MLLAAEGYSIAEIVRRVGVSKRARTGALIQGTLLGRRQVPTRRHSARGRTHL